jgi:quinoprotein glucose dehydrogenase
MKRILLLAILISVATRGVIAAEHEWPAYGGPQDKTHFSPLKQINRENVRQLESAWQFDTGQQGDTQTQPLMAAGKVFGYTPLHEVVALDPSTGALLWKFSSGIEGRGANRGLMFWRKGKDQRVFAAVDNFIYALDAKNGQPIASFGDHGRIDLRGGLDRDPDAQSVRLTTPGVIYRDLMIVGGRVSENLPASPGHIRAYDVKTGVLRWTFRTIPRPGEAGYETWPENAWTYIGGVNSWPGMTLDEKRGVVYVPTGSAASDFYGADRLGDNLFANCLIALDARTGVRRWHYQFVHHDLFDRDLPTAPVLSTLKKDGRSVDVLIQTTKQGYVFVLDRDTGQPVVPVEEVPVPVSTVPGEVAHPTQPLPRFPGPYARQSLMPDSMTTRTAEAARWAREQLSQMHQGGPFTPMSVGVDTVIYPGLDGGAEWGGPAFDPESKLLYINANEMAWRGSLALNDVGQSGKAIYLRECAVCHGDSRQGSPPQFPSLVDVGRKVSAEEFKKLVRSGAGRMPGFPNLQDEALSALERFVLHDEIVDVPASKGSLVTQPYRFTGYRRFVDPEGYPAVGTPWGTLNALDLNTGKYVWQIPFGEFPELVERGMRNTGSENYGGPLVTAGGLLFIGATIHDRKFRAFDKRTGELLWETMLPYSADATPITYEYGGRQYVVIFASGGKERGGSPKGIYVAFALPKNARN